MYQGEPWLDGTFWTDDFGWEDDVKPAIFGLSSDEATVNGAIAVQPDAGAFEISSDAASSEAPKTYTGEPWSDGTYWSDGYGWSDDVNPGIFCVSSGEASIAVDVTQPDDSVFAITADPVTVLEKEFLLARDRRIVVLT